MHNRPGKFIWLCLAVAISTLLAGPAPAAEFTATIVTKSGDEQRQGKIYVKGDKFRREFNNPSGTTVFIVPGANRMMWVVEPAIKSYLEMPFDNDAFLNNLEKPKEGGGSKLVGTETLNGYATDKYEDSVKTPTGARPGTIWFAKKLGVPIKMETSDKIFVQEYKDIKEGPVDDALFALPSGYQKRDR